MSEPWAPPPAPVSAPQAKSSTLAVLALVLSLLPICGISQVAAIILAIVHLATPGDRTSSRRLAIAAIPIAILMLLAQVGGVILLAALGSNQSDVRPSASASETVGPEDSVVTPSPTPAPRGSGNGPDLSTLNPGDCYTLSSDGNSVTGVNCASSHDGEVVGQTTLSGADNMPIEQMDALIEHTCDQFFAGYVGVSVDNSSLADDITWYGPMPSTWRQGDRSLTCAVEFTDQVDYSVKGSKK